MKNLGRMQKMWSAIIVTRNGTTEDFTGLEDKKNHKSSIDLFNVAKVESNDNEVSADLLSVSSNTDSLIHS